MGDTWDTCGWVPVTRTQSSLWFPSAKRKDHWGQVRVGAAVTLDVVTKRPGTYLWLSCKPQWRLKCFFSP